MKLGYIGLGLMGQPCVLNLLKAGYELSVYARRQASLNAAVAAGAVVCESPKALAHACDVVITNVSDSADVEELVLGDNGIIEAARPGFLLIDMSTISPIVTQQIAARLAQRGADMLDAPVSGGPQGAKTGTLSIMVGGKQAVFDQVLPLLNVLGENITYMGDHGAGQVTKACNQVIVAQMMEAIGEAFILARAAGVEPSQVREALMGGFAGSRILEIHGQRMLDDVYTPGFKAKLHQKDMAIVQQTCEQLGIRLPATEYVTGQLNESVALGLGEEDSSVLVKRLEALNKLKI